MVHKAGDIASESGIDDFVAFERHEVVVHQSFPTVTFDAGPKLVRVHHFAHVLHNEVAAGISCCYRSWHSW